MSRYYEDVDIPSGNFRLPRPPQDIADNLGDPTFHNRQSWVPLIGSNNFRPQFPPVPSLSNYASHTSNVYNYELHSQPNNYRRFPNRFKFNRNYSHFSNRPGVVHQNPRMEFDAFIKNVHRSSNGNFVKHYSKEASVVKEQIHPKKKESSPLDLESNQEAIKKSALAAKLRKSLENFQKDSSQKKSNLSIINNSDISKTDSSAKLTEIHPHFQWDLPLTVEDLKAIGRCPSGSVSDDLSGAHVNVSSIERQTYAQNTESSSSPPIETSPDIICIKHSRKRKSSESLGDKVNKRKFYIQGRRRHRSASPDLCIKSSVDNVDGDGQYHQRSHAAIEALNNSPLASMEINERSVDKEKSAHSSTVMQLLGIKRRELDELVNQPRSPRVHFMLGLLMKRHKELLLQRAMRSRISSTPSLDEPGCSQRPDLPNSDVTISSGVHDKPNKLEGMGASDTIDQLSDILLDSSLEIDISSLPQELIDQLGTFLEMSTDVSTFNDETGNSDQDEGSGRSVESHVFDVSGMTVTNECDNPGETLPQDVRSDEENVTGASKDSNVTKSNSFSFIRIKEEMVEDCRASVFGGISNKSNGESRVEKQNRTSKLDRIFGENMGSSIVKSERVGLVQKEIGNSVFSNTSREEDSRGKNSNVHLSSKILDISLSEDHVSSHPTNQSVQSADLEQESRNSFPSAADQPCVTRIESDGTNSGSDIIVRLWRIDLKILELMEEKKRLYEKLWGNGRDSSNFLTNSNAFSNPMTSTSSSFIPPNQEIPRTQPHTLPIKSSTKTVSSVSTTSEYVIQDTSIRAPEKSVHCIPTMPPSQTLSAPENVFPSTSENEPRKSIHCKPISPGSSSSRVSKYSAPAVSKKDHENLVLRTPIIPTSSASFSTPRYVVEYTSSKVVNPPKHLKKHEYVSLVSNICKTPVEEVTKLLSEQPPQISPPRPNSPKKVSHRQSSKEDECSCQDAEQPIQLSKEKCSDESVKSHNVPLDMNRKEIFKSEPSASHSRTLLATGPQSMDTSLDPAKGGSTDETIEIVYEAKFREDTSQVKEGELKGHKDAVLAIKVFGKYLFASCSDMSVYCFDLTTNEISRKFYGHTDTVSCIHVKLLGKKKFELYSGSHDKQLLVYLSEASRFQHSRTVSEPIQCMEEGWGTLYIGTKGGMIERYKIGRGDFIKPPLSRSKNEIMAIQTSIEGPRKVLVVASRNSPIVVRDAHSGLLLRSINEEMSKHITYSIFVHYGVVYSGTSIYGITACDYTNGKVLRTYRGCGSIVSVKVSEGKVYAASYDGNIYVYNIQSPRPDRVIKGSDKMLLCMEQRDNTIYTGSIDGKLKFWKLP